MHIADWLSRAYLETGNKTAAPDYQIFKMEEEDKLFKEIEQINPLEYIRLSGATGQQIKKETQGDTQLQSLMRMVLSGWPDSRCTVAEGIREYYGYREEITVHNGISYKGYAGHHPYHNATTNARKNT